MPHVRLRERGGERERDRKQRTRHLSTAPQITTDEVPRRFTTWHAPAWCQARGWELPHPQAPPHVRQRARERRDQLPRGSRAPRCGPVRGKHVRVSDPAPQSLHIIAFNKRRATMPTEYIRITKKEEPKMKSCITNRVNKSKLSPLLWQVSDPTSRRKSKQLCPYVTIKPQIVPLGPLPDKKQTSSSSSGGGDAIFFTNQSAKGGCTCEYCTLR
jgi:hypothetical protein